MFSTLLLVAYNVAIDVCNPRENHISIRAPEPVCHSSVFFMRPYNTYNVAINVCYSRDIHTHANTMLPLAVQEHEYVCYHTTHTKLQLMYVTHANTMLPLAVQQHVVMGWLRLVGSLKL